MDWIHWNPLILRGGVAEVKEGQTAYSGFGRRDTCYWAFPQEHENEHFLNGQNSTKLKIVKTSLGNSKMGDIKMA